MELIKNIKELFEILPPRGQGMIFSGIFFLYINEILNLINLIHNNILKFIFSLLVLSWAAYVLLKLYPWLSKDHF